jgi:hypothetical protein
MSCIFKKFRQWIKGGRGGKERKEKEEKKKDCVSDL